MTIIRQAERGDMPRIHEIAVLAWTPIFTLNEHLMGRHLFRTVNPDWRSDIKQQISSHFERNPQWTFVVEADDKVAGFLTYHLDSDKKIGEIGYNAVDPEYQGRGLGEAMHREVLSRFKEAGMVYAKVFTWLDDSHIPARAAYEKLGFKQMIRSVQYFMKL